MIIAGCDKLGAPALGPIDQVPVLVYRLPKPNPGGATDYWGQVDQKHGAIYLSV